MVLLELAIVAAEIATIAIAPFWALVNVWDSARPRGARLVAWLQFSIAFGLIWTLPLHALLVAAGGAGIAPIYGVIAPMFGVASVVLGLRVSAVHRRRLAGQPVAAPRLAAACLAFAATLALTLSPWIIGAPLHGVGFLGGEQVAAGDSAVYLMTALPIALAMACVASPLLPNGLVTRVGACLALIGVVAAPLALRGSRWDNIAVARAERAAQLRAADVLDGARQAALRPIAAGHPPSLAASDCPVADLGPDWRLLSRFVDRPASTDDVLRYASTWDYLFQRGVVEADRGGEPRSSFEGHRHRLLRRWVEDPDDWIARDPFWATAEQTRHLERARAGVDGWDFDLVLAIGRESDPDGALEGTLWVWSYSHKAVVCGADVRVDARPPASAAASAGSGVSAEQRRQALHLHALALATRNLRAVAR